MRILFFEYIVFILQSDERFSFRMQCIISETSRTFFFQWNNSNIYYSNQVWWWNYFNIYLIFCAKFFLYEDTTMYWPLCSHQLSVKVQPKLHTVHRIKGTIEFLHQSLEYVKILNEMSMEFYADRGLFFSFVTWISMPTFVALKLDGW